MKVSVVIPSYNQARYLAATLESVLGQDHADREILVFDGGSTDGSVALLESYGDRVRWTSGPDAGQADAINQGLRAADGDVLAYLNSDDVYYPGALSAVVTHFRDHPRSRALYGDAHHLHEDGSVMETYPTEPWDYARLLDVCYLCQPAVFWRREVVERFGVFDERLRYAMDYEYWLRVGRETPFDYLAGRFLAGSRLHGETKTLSQRVPVHRELLAVVARYADDGEPGPVMRWLKHLAHLHAAETTNADPRAELGERREFIRLYAARVLLYAREMDLALDAATLRELDGHLKGIGV